MKNTINKIGIVLVVLSVSLMVQAETSISGDKVLAGDLQVRKATFKADEQDKENHNKKSAKPDEPREPVSPATLYERAGRR